MRITRQTIELDGAWRLKLDPTQCGLAHDWANGVEGGLTVQVGRPWEYWYPGYDGIGWYECEIEIPEDWREGQVAIEFDAVSYYAECWLNGVHLGSHEGGFTTFELDASIGLRAGTTNRLVVRVINPPMDRAIEGFRSGAPLNQSDIPIGKLAWYYNYGGIWQGVRLIRRPSTAIKALRVFPDLSEDNLRIDVITLSREVLAGAILEMQIKDPATGQPVQSTTVEQVVEAGLHRYSFRMCSNDLRRWSLETPTLHQLTVVLRAGETVVDALDQRFGVREFTISGERFVLNGDPVFLNGFLHQGHYPRTLALPESKAFAREELEEVKRRGFNFLRIPMKPMPHWYLEMADEIGLLLMHEPPIGWIANGPKTRERCLREARELAERDANHPSVVIVGMFNESFHLLGFQPQEVLEITGQMALESRKIDPSRLIIDTSGGFSRKVLGGPDTMIHDSGGHGYQISRAMLPWSTDFMEIFDVHKYCRFPASDADVESYRQLTSEGHLLFIAEYGAPEVPPDFARVLEEYRPEEVDRQLEDWKLHKDFYDSLSGRFEQSKLSSCIPSIGEFITAIGKSMAADNRRIAHSIRSNPHVSGMCFCQLADASGELFGVTDVWRHPKPLYEALSSASANPAIGVHLPNRILWEGQALSVGVSLTADPGYRYAGKAEVRVRSEKGREVWSESYPVRECEGVMPVMEKILKVDLSAGVWEVVAEFVDEGGHLNRHVLEFRVLTHPDQRPRQVALRDADGRIETFMRKSGWSIETYGNNYRGKHLPVLLNIEAVPKNRAFYGELYGQLSKIVRLGGCAILFEPEVHALYHYLFPGFIRPQPVMRTCPYTLAHPVFENLPSGGIADYAYAEIFPEKWDCGEDIIAAGGEVLFGAFSMHMWTRPAAYFWGAGLYRIPIGRGNVIVCNLPVSGKILESPLAVHLLNNLVDYAQGLIQDGGEEFLHARCIDPLPEGAVEGLGSSGSAKRY